MPHTLVDRIHICQDEMRKNFLNFASPRLIRQNIIGGCPRLERRSLVKAPVRTRS
jgi:hypothetical protein